MTTYLSSKFKCSNCEGTGSAGNPPATCSNCSGTGHIENARIDITALDTKIDAIKADTSNIMDAVASIKSTVETNSGKIDNLQSTVDKILEIVQRS